MADIINLTNFPASPSQMEDGVRNVDNRDELSSLLLFTDKPTAEEITDRAERLADIAQASGADSAMIAGAPYLMSALEDSLSERGITPVYSFSERVSVDMHNDDGTVTKQTVFEHRGFIEAPGPEHRPDTWADRAEPGVDSGILNLTQHDSTDAQKRDGVVEPSDKGEIRDLLTFRGMPDGNTVSERAEKLADRAVESGCNRAMIGGAPYLSGPLERALETRNVTPLYAYSERKVEERVDPNTGKTERTITFEHRGFVEVPPHETKTDRDRDRVSNEEKDSPVERQQKDAPDVEKSGSGIDEKDRDEYDTRVDNTDGAGDAGSGGDTWDDSSEDMEDEAKDTDADNGGADNTDDDDIDYEGDPVD